MANTLIVLAAYLIGALPFGYLLVKWVKGIDIRTQGSGNIGMTNVWRVAGAGWGIATLALDISKGALSVWLAGHFAPGAELLKVICGLSALLGNVFPVYLKFKGGKGIGVSLGIFLSLLPLETAAAFGVFLVTLLLGRMVSLGSLLGAVTMVSLTLYLQLYKQEPWVSGLAVVAAVMIWWTHRQNIRRILNGTESRIGKKK